MDVGRGHSSPTSDDGHCPSCRARLASRMDFASARHRCARCRADIGVAGPEGEPRWFYPLPDEDEAQTDTPRQASATSATCTAPGAAAPQADVRVGSRYVLLGEFGRGGMGVVYQALDTELDRTVALKVLTAGRFASPKASARFLAEARTAAGVVHPGIVRVFDVGSHEGRTFFTMEEVRGPSLDRVVAAFPPMAPEEAARIAGCVARAVHHAHTQHVAHRDLKPANILLTTHGEPKVTDFGIAKALDDAQELTATQDLLGTPSFMAPEVARGEPDVDWIAVDVYGLGAVLYATLTGEPPTARAATLAQILESAGRGQIVPVRALRPDVPEPLAAVVHTALHADPARRYRSAAALAADLERWRAGEAVLARPEGIAEKARRLAWRWRRASAVALALLVLLASAALAPWTAAQLRWRAREAAAERAWSAVLARARDLLQVQGQQAAHEAIRTFVDTEEHRGTAAAFRASMALGETVVPQPQGLQTFDDQRPLDAWARALQDAPTDRMRAVALLRIARWLVDNHRHADLSPILDALAACDRDGALEAQILPLRLLWAVHTGRTEAATAAWARARDLRLPIATALADPGRAYRALPTGRPIAVIPSTEEVESMVLLPSGSYGAVLDPSRIVLALRPGGPAVEASGSVDADLLPQRGDVDGDGVIEEYRGQYRTGLIRERDGVVQVLGPDVGVPVTPEVHRVAVADLDGNGDPELVVGGGEWNTLDLRVLDGDGAGGLRLRARDHRNATARLVTIPDPWRPGQHLIASYETDEFTNRRVYGDAPAGPPAGLVIRRLVGDELQQLFFWPIVANGLYAADLDGDGVEEVLAGRGFAGWDAGRTRGSIVVWAGDAPDTFAVSALPHLALRGVADLDGDPELEMLAEIWRGDRIELWTLRTGDDALPVPPETARARSRTAPAPESSISATWATLRTVREAGLLQQAAEGFERLSRTSEAAVGAAAAREAAHAWAELERPDRAADAWEQAGKLAAREDLADDWRRAIVAWLGAAAPDRALAAARAWTDADGRGPQGELADVLRAWETSRALRIGLDDGLLDAMQLETPLAIDVRPDHLRVDSLAATRTLARVPLRPTGPVFVSADLSVEVAEWASSLELSLSAGDRTARIDVDVGGGGEYYYLTGGISLDGEPHDRRTPLDPDERTVQIRLTWTPWDQRWTGFLALPGRGRAWAVSHAGQATAASEAWTLQIVESPDGDYPTQWMSASFRALELWGARTNPASADRHRAYLALARHEPLAALGLLDADDALGQAAAHLQLADLKAAEAAIARADAAGQLHIHAANLLQTRRASWSRLVRSALGPARFMQLFDEVWRWEPVSEAYVQQALIEDLEGLDLSRHPELAAQRARALLHAGQLRRGEEEARAWLAAWTPEPGTPELADVASVLHRELASSAAGSGDLERARHHAEASIAVARWPELARDRLLVEPSLQGLQLDQPHR